MRRRITRMTVIVATLAVAVFAVPLAVVAFAYLLADERAELDRSADVAAITAAARLGAGQPVTTLVGAGRDPDARLALYDGEGHLVVGDGPPLADAVVQAATTPGRGPARGDTGTDLVAAVPVDTGSGAPGAVRAATPRSEVYGHLAIVGLGMAVLAVLAFGAAWLLSRRLAGRLTRPLEELADAARRLGGGDFTARGPASGVPEIDGVGEALADTADRIDKALARERAFSADASHQLRTPLAGLRLELEAAAEAGSDADPYQALRSAIAATDRLQATVEDLLDLARDTHTTGEPLDLDALLAGAVDTWTVPLASAGRRLRVRREDTPPTCASAGAVRQILTVLLDNAVTHGRGEVLLTVRDGSGRVAVDVADEGPGVTDPATLFTRRTGRSRGRGIGLALARSLAEAEGGRLVLREPSPPTFTLLLPLPGEPRSVYPG